MQTHSQSMVDNFDKISINITYTTTRHRPTGMIEEFITA